MSRFLENDDVLFSKDYGPIISDSERKLLENKIIKKVAYIPKPLLEELKLLKRQYINSNFFNFNESMIIRIGTKIVIEGMDNLVVSMIKDEDNLVKSLWLQFNLKRDISSDKGGSLYSHNVSSIVDTRKKNYETYCIPKTITMPYQLFADIKNAKSAFEEETGDYWIKDNTFLKIGLMLMLDVTKFVDIKKLKTEDDILNAVRISVGIEQ